MSPTEPGRECYHCKQWIADGQAHDCWTTTESALTRDLSDDLREAWERLRETAAEFGEQRIYASHNSIMFAPACYSSVGRSSASRGFIFSAASCRRRGNRADHIANQGRATASGETI